MISNNVCCIIFLCTCVCVLFIYLFFIYYVCIYVGYVKKEKGYKTPTQFFLNRHLIAPCVPPSGFDKILNFKFIFFIPLDDDNVKFIKTI